MNAYQLMGELQDKADDIAKKLSEGLTSLNETNAEKVYYIVDGLIGEMKSLRENLDILAFDPRALDWEDTIEDDYPYPPEGTVITKRLY